jgi:hypothetical protein
LANVSLRSIRCFMILAALTSITALAGCGAQSTAQNMPGATPSPAASATPSATPLPTVDPTPLAQKCGNGFPTMSATVVGGLAVAQQTIFGNLAYPAKKLPDDLPLKPYQVQLPNGQPDPALVPVNPSLYKGGGYVIVICNISSVPHTVKRIDARIAAVTPISVAPNVAPSCQGPYARQYGSIGGGCGGADYENEYMLAAFSPSAGVGATVTATQTDSNTCQYSTGCVTNYGPLPVTLRAGQGMTIEIGMASLSNATPVFTTPGYYTFSFGVGVDGAAPVFAATSSQALLTPSVREWTGDACLSSAMQAQIPPATTPPSYYLCPAS